MLFIWVHALSHLRVIRPFGVLFATIVEIVKEAAYLLVIMLGILIGFSYAFYMLVATYTDNNSTTGFDNSTNPNSTFQSDYFGSTWLSINSVYYFIMGDYKAIESFNWAKNLPLDILKILFSSIFHYW
ncbi:hypothetical protein BC938DRAFT_479461 [Jimgerdemannia flammicorona]|uniref:Ion transport domain-containing protein n=1 Tax=Jimgerdemannia flammicorona TaxID=994334 RepID=A0A433QKT6_9FUNG|nr:hypothetical protein BC938DRAFT_479461 [Jimgerdemannia flammicorona]